MTEKRNRELNNARFFTAAFAAVLFGIFALYLILPQNTFSPKENRVLQTRPKPALSDVADGSFMTTFETYTTEQLPFRDLFIQGKALINSLCLAKENNGVVRGKDDYLFEKVYGISDKLSKNETAVIEFIKETDRPVVVAIAPNASEVLKDYVPKGFPRVDEETELNSFYGRIEAIPNGNAVDLLSPLRKQTDLQLYYRTDHHWTTQGAYLGYREIMSMLDAANAANLPAPVDPGTLEKHEAGDFYGTLAAKYKALFQRPDTLVWYEIPVTSYTMPEGTYDSLYDPEKLSVYDKYAFFLRSNDSLCEIGAENAKNGRHLMVFKDSYANCLIPFLTYQYDRITVVDLRFFSDSVKELLMSDPDADILLLYHFQFLNEDNHFYRLTS
ncbi:MAG: hypothetical protein IKS87_00400 [Lachnospiraceae bacterium]|nr:hypothetical protein [Lachnospiraceae bacterium]